MPKFSAVDFGPGRREDFLGWLQRELRQTLGDREELEREWEDRLLQWRSKHSREELDFPYPGAPLSRDTEILTRTGWKTIDAVEVGEHILTRRDEDETLHWEPVQAKPYVWADELLHLQSETVDLLMTPGHACVLKNPRGETLRKNAHEFWGKTGYRIPLTGVWEGVDAEELFGLDAGDVAEFVGWYISEGSGAGKGSIHISQKKPGYRGVIEALIQRLGFSYSKTDSDFIVHVRTMPKELVWWLDMGVCDEKYIPSFFYGASPRILKRLFYGLLGGDGTIKYRHGATLPVLTYYTTSPRLADDVQALAQLMGKRAAIRCRNRAEALVPAGGVIDGRKIEAKRASYEVAILHSPNAKINPEHYRENVEYNDFAFCVTVANHAIYVRRNGKACWTGNSNLEVPLTAMHSDPVFADLVQSIHAPEDLWTPTARRRDTVDLVTALRRGMTQIERRYLKMRSVNLKTFLEVVIQGTSFYKNGWRSEMRGRRRYAADGSSERRIRDVSEPSIEHPPIQRIFFPAYAWSLDFDAPGGTKWIAQEFRLDKEEFARYRKGSSELPGFDSEAAEAVATHFVDEDEKIRRQTQRDDKFRPFAEEHVKIYEVWCRYDVTGEGVYDDVVATIHLDGPHLLRAIYFPNAHGRHPFHAINYLPGFGIYGIGMAEIDEWAQEGTTQLLNATIDNARLANTRMFKAPLGMGLTQNTQAFPGKVWYVGPDEDVGEVRLSEVYPSGFQLLQNLMTFSELRSGVNELRQGSITSLPSRTPATSLLSILREGNKRFDLVHSNVRDVLGEMGLRMLQNVAQRAQEDSFRWSTFFNASVGPEDAQKIMSVLLAPDVDEIEESFGITLTATSAQVNKEVEKQSFIGMLQISQQIYSALIQTAILMAQVPDEVVQTTARAAFTSGVDLLAQLFERFDVKNPQEHLGNLEAIAGALQGGGSNAALSGLIGPQGLVGPQGFGGGAAPPQTLDPRQIASILGLG